MPACIKILSGPGSGSEHWIQRPVVLIGSRSDADVSLPSADIAPHALTVEFRNQRYAVSSRSDRPFFIAKREVVKHGSDIWSHGEQLEFPGVAVLVLSIGQDPSPVPKPVTIAPAKRAEDPVVGAVPSDDTGANIAKPAGFSQKEKVQVAVTIACVLGIISMIAFKMAPQKHAADVKTTITFEDVLADARDSISQRDDKYQAFINEAKEARVLSSKGDIDGANLKLLKVREDLHQLRNSLGKFDQDYQERLYQWVAVQLASLN